MREKIVEAQREHLHFVLIMVRLDCPAADTSAAINDALQKARRKMVNSREIVRATDRVYLKDDRDFLVTADIDRASSAILIERWQQQIPRFFKNVRSDLEVACGFAGASYPDEGADAYTLFKLAEERLAETGAGVNSTGQASGVTQPRAPG